MPPTINLLEDIEDKKIPDTCKGLFWRGNVSSYITDNGLTIGVKKTLRFLKKMSCPGCKHCGWVLDFIDEDIGNDSLLDYIGEIEKGAIYTHEVDGDSEGIDGIYFVKVKG